MPKKLLIILKFSKKGEYFYSLYIILIYIFYHVVLQFTSFFELKIKFKVAINFFKSVYEQILTFRAVH